MTCDHDMAITMTHDQMIVSTEEKKSVKERSLMS